MTESKRPVKDFTKSGKDRKKYMARKFKTSDWGLVRFRLKSDYLDDLKFNSSNLSSGLGHLTTSPSAPFQSGFFQYTLF